MILRQLDFWLQPELCLTVAGYDVDMHSFLFPREKEKPVSVFSEYGRTHTLVYNASLHWGRFAASGESVR